MDAERQYETIHARMGDRRFLGSYKIPRQLLNSTAQRLGVHVDFLKTT